MDRDRPPGGEHRRPPVVAAQRRARGAVVERRPGGRGVDLQLRVEHRRLHAQVGGEPRLRAEEPVGAHGVGFAGPAHAGGLADDLADPVERNLEGDGTDELPAVEHRRRDEARRLHQARQVAVELGEGDGVAGAGGEGFLHAAAEVGAGDRPRAERRGEVDLLADAVDERAARGIDEEQIVEPVLLLQAPQDRMVDGVGLGVGRVVRRGVEPRLLAERMLVAAEVEILQPDRLVVEGRHQGAGVGLGAGRLAEGGGEVAGVEALERAAGPGDALLVDGVVGQDGLAAGRELADGGCDHPVLGEHPQLVVQRGEVPLHALAGDRVDRLELLEGLLAEGGRRGLLA